MQNSLIQRIKENNHNNEKSTFSPNACLSINGLRRHSDTDETDVRSKFSRDTDRIIHSMAYTRYIDKTQVFYLIKNDHITHRVLHVQLVSKIAREIGRELSLNCDLIEAIALGHDIGHTPFGHEGEHYLNSISKKYGISSFRHNVQSVRFLEDIEASGNGLNLTLQVLDGILTHNGEWVEPKLVPKNEKTWKIFDKEKSRNDNKIVPMTLEGCVVRFSDVFGYIGRDIEDAIKVGLIKKTDLPADCTDILGDKNRDIVNTLVLDLVENSYEKNYIALSRPVFNALDKLRKFNYKNIYLNKKIKTQSDKIKRMFELLFKPFYTDLENKNESSKIYTNYLNFKNERYRNNTASALIVRDFIAGMTNAYLINTFEDLFIPKKFGEKFN